MSIEVNARCLLCRFRKNMETALSFGDDDRAAAFARELMELYLSLPEGTSTPLMGPGETALLKKYYGLDDDRFRKEKEDSNRFVMERLDAIRTRVQAETDPVFAGLQHAILGNYIDFSALHGQVSFEKLDELLAEADKIVPEGDAYTQLCEDLEKGSKLLYITDNAGEIGFDRVFAEEIQKKYPHLQITFLVRGGPTMNDATREDAAAVGIPFPVIDNGRAIAGTDLSRLSAQAREAFEAADVIISKGQGNVESLYGCGYNIYYAFLVKCQRFMDLFQEKKFTPMLVRERK